MTISSLLLLLLLLTLLYLAEGQAAGPDSLATAQFSIFFLPVTQIVPRRYRAAQSERQKRNYEQFFTTESFVTQPDHEIVDGSESLSDLKTLLVEPMA